MNLDIACIQKKAIQKKFIYFLVFLLLLMPFLYFTDGSFSEEIDTDGNRTYSIKLLTQQMTSAHRAADAWYANRRSVREPEQSVRRSSVLYSGLCIDAVSVQFYQREIREHTRKKYSGRPTEAGRSNWRLRAPPVYEL